MPIHERFEVTQGQWTLTGEHAGRGPALVFLHAGVADRRMWRTELEAFASTHHALAYDRRGFGESRGVPGPFSHVDDLAAVLDSLGARQAVLVGCSQGGRVALDFTLAHPDRVRSLVLVAPAVSGAPVPAEPAPSVARLSAHLEEAEARGDVERVNALEAHLWLDGPDSPEGRVGGAARALFLDMNGIALRAPSPGVEREPPPALPRLGELRVPTRVVCGDLDVPHLQERCALLARGIPGADLRVMAGCAHLPNLEQPRAFALRVRELLERLGA
ncbi:alpha/beta fold hydrolase [Pyxidicoccus xibeiensis]|uniref:alpha/beta fold hydrolase n=1 Tax=Pyxidicoccus xibeiensis TaxID=2906759 RepID=UPI0020A80884|nr:alpha/beta fold hydrolase [Pyxidicoccus xibeiensis]MCP3140169.1 alpha/beta hydrolase [Pyxidicoccus xibeiensis]